VVGGVFGRAAPTYGLESGPPFAHFGRRLAERANLQPGWHVLDVAAGRGAVTFSAAEMVGTTGRVLATDLAAGMVAEMGADIARRGLKNVEIRRMDAEELDLPASTFDAVLCGFGLMFFPNLGRALGEMLRVLKLNGVLAVTTWVEFDQRWRWFLDMVRDHPGQRGAPRIGAQRLDKPEALTAALVSAGFADVVVVSEPHEIVMASEAVWWESLWSHGQRAGLETISPDALADFKAAAFSRAQALREPDGLHQVHEALIAIARRV
jgi:O-methyltransferase/aklanonic acid methyltransferase